MRNHQLMGFSKILLAVMISVPAWAYDTRPDEAVPGTLNYVEGTVSLGSQALNSKLIGKAELRVGQSLTTRTGKAEILLTPGVFLRVSSNTSVNMISSSLMDTGVRLDRGHAMVEVAEIHPENDIYVTTDGETTRLLKTGLYDFDLKQEQLRVFDGKARIQYANRHVDVKGGREVSLLDTEQHKARKFDKKAYYGGGLYRWSSLRSAYVAESNVGAAAAYANYGWGPWGFGWWGSGWYWDPWFDGFTFIPGDGIFYSPFGWGFYSPWCVDEAPFFGGYGYPGSGVFHHFSTNTRNWGVGSHYVGSRSYSQGIYRGPGSAGAFHAGARSGGFLGFGNRGFGGGGFHSSARGGSFPAGGFHGGGFHGGGFHGGGGRR